MYKIDWRGVGSKKRSETQFFKLEIGKYRFEIYLNSTGKLPADPAREEFHQLLVVHIQELIKIDTSVSKLTEGPLLLHIGKLSFVRHFFFCKLQNINNYKVRTKSYPNRDTIVTSAYQKLPYLGSVLGNEFGPPPFYQFCTRPLKYLFWVR